MDFGGQALPSLVASSGAPCGWSPPTGEGHTFIPQAPLTPLPPYSPPPRITYSCIKVATLNPPQKHQRPNPSSLHPHPRRRRVKVRSRWWREYCAWRQAVEAAKAAGRPPPRSKRMRALPRGGDGASMRQRSELRQGQVSRGPPSYSSPSSPSSASGGWQRPSGQFGQEDDMYIVRLSAMSSAEPSSIEDYLRGGVRSVRSLSMRPLEQRQGQSFGSITRSNLGSVTVKSGSETQSTCLIGADLGARTDSGGAGERGHQGQPLGPPLGAETSPDSDLHHGRSGEGASPLPMSRVVSQLLSGLRVRMATVLREMDPNSVVRQG